MVDFYSLIGWLDAVLRNSSGKRWNAVDAT